MCWYHRQRCYPRKRSRMVDSSATIVYRKPSRRPVRQSVAVGNPRCVVAVDGSVTEDGIRPCGAVWHPLQSKSSCKVRSDADHQHGASRGGARNCVSSLLRRRTPDTRTSSFRCVVTDVPTIPPDCRSKTADIRGTGRRAGRPSDWL